MEEEERKNIKSNAEIKHEYGETTEPMLLNP